MQLVHRLDFSLEYEPMEQGLHEAVATAAKVFAGQSLQSVHPNAR